MWKTGVALCACVGVLMLACSNKSNPTGPVTYGPWINYLHSSNDTIPDNFVDAIAVDAAGFKWFGTSDLRNDNLFSFLKTSNGTVWTGYNTANGLPNSSVLAVAIDSQGNKWVGFQGGGVSMFNGTTWTTYTANSGLVDPHNVVQCITIDKQGNQWFGTSAGFSERSHSGQWTNYYNYDGTPADWNGFNLNNVHCIAIDLAGVLWIGSDLGLIKFNAGGDTVWKVISLFNAWGCYGITVDKQNNKWISVGSGGGVGKVNAADSAFFVYQGPSAFQSVLDKAGYLWVATSGDSGIIRIDPLTYQKINYPGLASYNTYSITLDSSGNIWCGSDQGIHKLLIGSH